MRAKMLKYKIQNKLFNFYCLFDILSMLRNDKLSADALRKLQNNRLQKLIKRAYQVPFYRKRFDDAGITPGAIKTKDDLYKLPILTKTEYREWMQKELNNPIVKDFKFTKTSGSTGIPTTNIYPPIEYAQHYMMDMWGWMKGGYNPFRGRSLTKQPGDGNVGTHSFIQKLGILRRECFDTHWNRADIVRRITEYQPDFLLANSSELIYIAQFIKENNLTIPKPKYYCPNGENIDGLAEKILKETYGDGLINLYGCTEMASFAVKAPGNNDYEVMSDLVAVTVMTENGMKAEGSGTIIATPLYRLQYPLINYEVGDTGDVFLKDYRTIISRIKGRSNDFFSWANGKTTIFMRLWDITSQLEDIYQIRFIQETDTNLLIQVVKDTKTSKTENELEKYLTTMYKKEFDGLNVRYEWLSVIPPDPNGKLRIMISKIKKDNKK